jgi:hypothetical protein
MHSERFFCDFTTGLEVGIRRQNIGTDTPDAQV